MNIPKDFLAEEERCGYLVTSEMKAVWAVQLTLLAHFDQVCRTYGLRYFAGGGTLLGAVRHGGYIPWDDDIDLFMLRADYDRLLAVGEEAFLPPYFLQTAYNDTRYGRGHAQLRMDGTTAILAGERGRYTFHQGIFIDIFPLDAVPDDREAQIAQRRRLARWNRLLAASVRYAGSPHKTTVKSAVHGVLSLIPYRWLYRGMERECRRYEGEPTDRVALLTFAPAADRWVMPRVCYSDEGYLPFEFTDIPVPVDCDRILAAAYGDYLTLRQDPTCHSGVFYDPHRDYHHYLRKEEWDGSL